MAPPRVVVRPVEPGDRDRWAELFRAYRGFYRLEPDEAVLERVWRWLGDPTVEVDGLVAVEAGTVQGIAHHRRFLRPSAGAAGLHLDDLFTDPAARGRGIGRALIAHLRDLARAEGLSVVRWITAEDNTTARALYDSVAAATRWVTYDLTP